MHLVSDISNDVCKTREEEHILALEARVDELEKEVRQLRSKKQRIVEVTPTDMVSMETYNKLRALYDQLWDDTMAF